jgi:tetratricopeptide (TPR) repeat protein
MIKKSLFLISIFLFLSATTHAGQILNSRIVDSITYQDYLDKNWDHLIDYGNQALRQEIDFFYLRVRMGIACYEKKRYVVAVEHFTRARTFNSSDPFNNEYLYLALLYANRPDEAIQVAASIPPDRREALKVKTSVVDQVHVEAGPTFNPGYNKQQNQNLMGSDGIYGESDRYGNSFYANAAITFNLSRRVNLTAAYSYLSFQKKKRVQDAYYTDRLDSTVVTSWGYQNYWSFPLVSTDTTWSGRMNSASPPPSGRHRGCGSSPGFTC